MIMKNDFPIIQQIERIVGDAYSDWKIGRKPGPWKHKYQEGHPLTWLQWQADSSASARRIEQFFVEKGMKSTGENPWASRYILIFR